MNNRLTLNLGVRWDYVDGIPFNQDGNPNFQALQAAGRDRPLCRARSLEDFGQEPRGDKDNVQPRLGFAYDLRGNGRDIIRGGWGIYTDFGYTNANVLTAAIDAAGGGGPVFVATTPTGIRRPDGTFFQVSRSAVDRSPPRTRSTPTSRRWPARWSRRVLEQPYTHPGEPRVGA